MTYGKRTLIAVDQLFNAILGGWPDETLSSRCYRWDRDGVRTWPRKFVDGLFFWQKEHCKSSYESEKEDSCLLSCVHLVQSLLVNNTM